MERTVISWNGACVFVWWHLLIGRKMCCLSPTQHNCLFCSCLSPSCPCYLRPTTCSCLRSTYHGYRNYSDRQVCTNGNSFPFNTINSSTNWDFCCLLINFSNSLDPDWTRQNVGSDLDSNCLTQMVFLKHFFLKS